MLAVFRSRSPYLSVPGKPFNTSAVVEGRQVIHSVTPTFAFKNHIFSTSDKDVAEYLRTLKGWIGVYYTEDKLTAKFAETGESEDQVKGKDPTKVPNIKARNAAITYLKQKKGMDTTQTRAISDEELKALALRAYNIVFPDWE